MILSNTKEASKYLPSLNLTVDNDRLTDFFRRAQEWVTSHIIGTDIEALIDPDLEPEEEEPTEPSIEETIEEIEETTEDATEEDDNEEEDPHAKLRTLCQRVIAERALLDGIPELDLQLTEAGFAVQDNDNFSPASQARVDRLLAKMPERIAADTDALVRYLLKNSNGTRQDPNPYDSWRGTDQFKYMTEAFIPLMEQYNKLALAAFKLTTYEDFYAAIPVMAREMMKVADYYVSRKEVCRLRDLYRDNEVLQVHRMAIAELKAVAVAAYAHDTKCARDHASSARDIMLDDPNNFPMFKDSPAFTQKSVNLDGGKMVNFL